MSKTLDYVRLLLEANPKAKTITLRAATLRHILERSKEKAANNTTGRLRRQMYRTENSLRRVAEMITRIGEKLEQSRTEEAK